KLIHAARKGQRQKLVLLGQRQKLVLPSRDYGAARRVWSKHGERSSVTSWEARATDRLGSDGGGGGDRDAPPLGRASPALATEDARAGRQVEGPARPAHRR